MMYNLYIYKIYMYVCTYECVHACKWESLKIQEAAKNAPIQSMQNSRWSRLDLTIETVAARSRYPGTMEALLAAAGELGIADQAPRPL
jgi:hypothetical protein